MTDRVNVYRDASKEWRWQRISENGNIVADSGEGYKNKEDCVIIATEVNASPFNLEVVLVNESLKTSLDDSDEVDDDN